MSTRQHDFQQKMARLNAKAQASGRKVSTYDPYASPAAMGPTSARKLAALAFEMALVVAVRALVFHNPGLLEPLVAQGIPAGLIGDWVLPVLAGIIIPRLVGLAGRGLNFWGLLGFLIMFIGEDLFFIQTFPEQWALLYSPEYVEFVTQSQGNLGLWLDSGRAGLPAGESPGIGAVLNDLLSSVTGDGEEP